MSADGGRKGRRLSKDEHTLWQGVTRSIKPLLKRAPKPDTRPERGLEDEKPAIAKLRKAVAAHKAARPPVRPKSPPPLAPIDRRTKQSIARGKRDIDGRIDLHGHTQAEAHAALLRFLRASQANGSRVVLVITGKGVRGEAGRERGVLRRQVPLWLALAEFRDYVVGFDEAAIGHGGEGALYVRLRKQRA